MVIRLESAFLERFRSQARVLTESAVDRQSRHASNDLKVLFPPQFSWMRSEGGETICSTNIVWRLFGYDMLTSIPKSITEEVIQVGNRINL